MEHAQYTSIDEKTPRKLQEKLQKKLQENKKMTLKIFIENHFYGLLVLFLVLANAVLVLVIVNTRIYCCKYCRLSHNGRRIAQLQTNRCESFIHEQLENANHRPLRLV